jgi:hypothetical protein
VVAQKPVIVDPAITSTVDSGTMNRLTAYLKAANADYALIGYVYKTSDSQLTAGTALFSSRKQGFTTLTPVSFDTDVLTANTEAFKLSEETVKRLTAFGNASQLPINLATRPRNATVLAKNDANTNPDDMELSGPKSKKVVLVPQPKVKPEEEVQPPVEISEKPNENKPPEVKSGVPAWVWIVTGVAVAAGAGVGGYFGISAATKPVTGTVTATW